ncbi:hypothetical protein [Roseovarius sp. M141]|uniref:hypothetical protein n=1 Tax=Roseovarius sp. M141 TaxID=2583806 RepID=UPI0020CC5080|nr:hypothetical protein [Roseovarius sp. M141]MCQ0092082.1 hypothetical protein [Roseovarius sp. M141]
MRHSFALALIAALGAGSLLPGCAQFPQLDATLTDQSRRAPYPDLVPLSGLQARINDTDTNAGAAPAIEARIARLKSRAARLRGTVIDSDTRTRMQAGVRAGVQQ